MNRGRYKRAKMGMRPGDIGFAKIQMMESKSEFNLFPWQTVTVACIKSFRKDQHKRAKIQDKRRGQRDICEGLKECDA